MKVRYIKSLNEDIFEIDRKEEYGNKKWYPVNGLSLIKNGEKYAFLNDNMENAFDEWYDYAESFSEGYAPIYIKDKGFNVIDTNGIPISDIWYAKLNRINDCLWEVGRKKREKYKWNIMNKYGSLVLNRWADFIEKEDVDIRFPNKKDDFDYVIAVYDEEYTTVLIDRYGDIIFNKKGVRCMETDGEKCSVMRTTFSINEYNLYNIKTGKYVLDMWGKACPKILNNNLYVYIDINNALKILNKKGKCETLDKDVLKIDNVDKIKNIIDLSYFSLKHKLYHTVLSKNGTQLYDKLSFVIDAGANYILIQKDEKSTIIDGNGNEILKKPVIGCYSIYNCGNDFNFFQVLYKNGNKIEKNFVDINGNLILKKNFDTNNLKYGMFPVRDNDNLFFIYKEDGFNLINRNSEIILDNFYKSIMVKNNIIYAYDDGDNKYMFDLNGNEITKDTK